MSTDNKNIMLHGKPVEVSGNSISVGQAAPDFTLTGPDLKDLRLSDLKDKIIILSVVPSVDTPTCQVQTRKFNEAMNSLGEKVTLLTVSRDLPFALTRFCGAEGLNNVKVASDYKYRTFGKSYGVDMEGAALLARAVFVIDLNGKIGHLEYVSEVSAEPDYAAASDAVNSLL